MNHHKFMQMVISEYQIRSEMTMCLSKTQNRKFRKWFFKKGKRCFDWNNWKCQKEFNQFCKTFNIGQDHETESDNGVS